MPLTSRSRQHLDEVHGDLRAVLLRAAEITTQPFEVTDGMRTQAEQRELLRKGRTTTMNSRHLTGHAGDLVAMVNGKPDFNDRTPYRPIWEAVRTAAAELGVPVEWGGDWKSFVDVFHFQLPWAEYPKGADVSFLDAGRSFDAGKFEKVVALTLDTEQGWNPVDPSMRGVTLETLRRWQSGAGLDDLKALSEEKAKLIYRALYWHPVRGDDLPPGLDYAVFDFAVHSGPQAAVSHLQEIIGTQADGIAGPVTMAAVKNAAVPDVIGKLMGARLARMKTLSNWEPNADGWTRRIASVRKEALAMASIEPPQPEPQKPLRPKSLADFTDADLIAELLRRPMIASVNPVYQN